MSCPSYNEVLTKLMEFVGAATEEAGRRRERMAMTLSNYREEVVECYRQVTDPFLADLPDVEEYGALVTLREYGQRNRDDIVRRIRAGIFKLVETSYGR